MVRLSGPVAQQPAGNDVSGRPKRLASNLREWFCQDPEIALRSGMAFQQLEALKTALYRRRRTSCVAQDLL